MYFEKEPKEVQIGLFYSHEDLYDPKRVIVHIFPKMPDQHFAITISIKEVLLYHGLVLSERIVHFLWKLDQGIENKHIGICIQFVYLCWEGLWDMMNGLLMRC